MPAREASAADLAGFCDVGARAGEGRALVLPPLDRPLATAGPGEWRWVSVWATWCRPCVAEMPMILDWQRELRGSGARLSVQFVSIDETDEAVGAFRRRHRDLPPSSRLADPAALPGWLEALGLDAGATIPLHVFADPSGRLRCVRSGAVGAADLATVRALVSGS